MRWKGRVYITLVSVDELCGERGEVCEYCRRYWLSGHCCLFYKRVLCLRDDGLVEIRPTWLRRAVIDASDSN